MDAKENASRDELYSALLERDSRYEGIWFVAVRTTGIFCRLSCTARKPKKENVEFYRSIKSALDHGYRPCKICKPHTPPGEVPPWISSLLDELSTNPDAKINDRDIRGMGIDPVRVRRWFKKHHGMTFHAYQRMLRLNRAFGNIRAGEKVINAAFDSGYDSLSGFSEQFKNLFGSSPKNLEGKQVVSITRILTPLGPMLAGATGDGLCLVEFTDRRMLETQITRLRKALNAVFLPGVSRYFKPLEKQLKEYFDGERKDFDVPLVLAGTPFQEKDWRALMEIPYGQTRSYSEQAEAIGNKAAVRAVARANGDNRIGIIIPCHRVIGSNGSLTGYGGGLWRKKHLLELERGNRI